MLQANKANVITGFHLKALDIRNAELCYFLMVFDKMSSIAGFLGGFASSALAIQIWWKIRAGSYSIVWWRLVFSWVWVLSVEAKRGILSLWDPNKVPVFLNGTQGVQL